MDRQGSFRAVQPRPGPGPSTSTHQSGPRFRVPPRTRIVRGGPCYPFRLSAPLPPHCSSGGPVSYGSQIELFSRRTSSHTGEARRKKRTSMGGMDMGWIASEPGQRLKLVRYLDQAETRFPRGMKRGNALPRRVTLTFFFVTSRGRRAERGATFFFFWN